MRAVANEHGWSRHQPALPLYGAADVEQTSRLLRPVAFHEPVPVRRVRGARSDRPATSWARPPRPSSWTARRSPSVATWADPTTRC